MKIAILSDIHANIISLKNVINDFENQGIEHVCILGDIVGYYYWPVEVINLVNGLSHTTHIIQGNHERLLKEAQNCQIKKKKIYEKYGSGINIALEKLSQDEKEFLYSLPKTKTLSIEGLNILLCHGSKNDPDQYIYPDSNLETLHSCIDTDYDYIFQGHTHYPFIFSSHHTTLANPGSVGQPRDIGHLASYMILNSTSRSIVQRRIEFDYKSISDEIKQLDYHLPYLIEVFQKR
ncbi:MAG: metallophosphoesterase family protein [bacterium]